MKTHFTLALPLAILLTVALVACAPVVAPAASAPTPAATQAAAEVVATPEASEEATVEATVDATVEATEEATAEAPTGMTPVVAVDAAECSRIQAAVAERLGVEFTVEETDFTSEVAMRAGTACTLTATGTGQDFGNFVDTAQAIREVLVTDGWTENINYQADGPTGTATGFEKENQLALVSVDWQPSAAVQCPADQPISACNVEPSQQIFTVIITLSQAS